MLICWPFTLVFHSPLLLQMSRWQLHCLAFIVLFVGHSSCSQYGSDPSQWAVQARALANSKMDTQAASLDEGREEEGSLLGGPTEEQEVATVDASLGRELKNEQQVVPGELSSLMAGAQKLHRLEEKGRAQPSPCPFELHTVEHLCTHHLLLQHLLIQRFNASSSYNDIDEQLFSVHPLSRLSPWPQQADDIHPHTRTQTPFSEYKTVA